PTPDRTRVPAVAAPGVPPPALPRLRSLRLLHSCRDRSHSRVSGQWPGEEGAVAPFAVPRDGPLYDGRPSLPSTGDAGRWSLGGRDRSPPPAAAGRRPALPSTPLRREPRPR